jgi:hypothetical protein
VISIEYLNIPRKKNHRQVCSYKEIRKGKRRKERINEPKEHWI